MDNDGRGGRARRLGVTVMVFGLGLISGLAVGRNVEPTTTTPALPMFPSDSLWATEGPAAQFRDQQMEQMAEMLKARLELDAEQVVEFDRIQARVKADMERLMQEVGPRVAETVMGAAAELRAILNEEQLERLDELPMPPMMVAPRPGGPGPDSRR